MRRRIALRAARWAGTLVHWRFHRMLPGLAGAALVSLGAGMIVGHVFGHDLALWTVLALSGGFLLLLAAEMNRGPRRRPARPDTE